MSYSRIILRDAADIVWPLDDINSSSSISQPINFFNQNPYSYSASINILNTDLIDNPMIYGGGTLLSFTASSVGMSIPALGRFSELYENKPSSMSLWFQSSFSSSEEVPIWKKRGYDNIGLFIKNNYLIFKYGTTDSYVQVQGDIEDLGEPNHIVLGRSPNGLSMIINGNTFTSSNNLRIKLDKDSSHEDNDFIDFYGPLNNDWRIDSPAIYPNLISESIAKKHYVYGLGKSVGDSLFYSRGGTLYNFSTISTEKIFDISWRYPKEWINLKLTDLVHKDDGIKPLSFSLPTLYTNDNNIVTINNNIKFSSTENTNASYIQVRDLYEKMLNGNNPVFVKFKLDGDLPSDYTFQRLITYGILPDKEVLTFDLYNNNGTYQINIKEYDTSASTYFTIQNISSSPDIYVGMKFNGQSEFYFSQTGSAIYTASFSYTDGNGFGIDPLTPYFPPNNDYIIRIGSRFNYNSSNFTINTPNNYQFFGTFNNIFVTQPDFSASANFEYLDQYKKYRFFSDYLSNEKRFRVKSYGSGTFNLHGIDLGYFIDDTNYKVGSNFVEWGYPDITSGSQVYLYATLLEYSGSVSYPQTQLSQLNYLSFINNTNMFSKYLKFDLEIYADDSAVYPPKIKYFNMQTYKSINNNTELKDESGEKYVIYPNSSSYVYLPEAKQTPTIFMKDSSGIKINQNLTEFSENIIPKPLDPRTIEGIKLWLDSRFINGLEYESPQDDSRVILWKDLSGNLNDAEQSISASAPVFRVQSLNLLRNNQLNGSEDSDLSFITGYSASVNSSPNGVINGLRSLEIIPDGTSIDSYIDISTNTASITVFPNQSYTVVGTVTLDKPQTASALSDYSRRIVVYTSDGVSELLSASSFYVDNITGSYSVSATFTTSSSTQYAEIRLYNGSFDSNDPVYWDNLGLYSVSDITGLREEWVQVLTENDHPTIKFDGHSTFMTTAASANQPYTIYVVGRAFNDGVFVGYSASGASIFSYDGYYYVDSGTSASQISATNEFNIYSITFNSGSAKLFLNGLPYYKVESGHDSIIDGLLLGKGNVLGVNSLSGDISAVLLYEGNHDYLVRSNIEAWLDESFNLIHTVLPVTPANDIYLDEYTERYPLLPWL